MRPASFTVMRYQRIPQSLRQEYVWICQGTNYQKEGQSRDDPDLPVNHITLPVLALAVIFCLLS